MIITTTPSIEGKRITEYKGIVSAEIVAVGCRTTFTGKSLATVDSDLYKARTNALALIEERAEKLGANAVVGLTISNQLMIGCTIIVTALGTLVVVE